MNALFTINFMGRSAPQIVWLLKNTLEEGNNQREHSNPENKMFLTFVFGELTEVARRWPSCGLRVVRVYYLFWRISKDTLQLRKRVFHSRKRTKYSGYCALHLELFMNGAMPCHALLVIFTNNWQNCHYLHEEKYVVKKCWVNNNKYLTDRSVIITPVLYTHLYFKPTYKGRDPLPL